MKQVKINKQLELFSILLNIKPFETFYYDYEDVGLSGLRVEKSGSDIFHIQIWTEGFVGFSTYVSIDKLHKFPPEVFELYRKLNIIHQLNEHNDQEDEVKCYEENKDTLEKQKEELLAMVKEEKYQKYKKKRDEIKNNKERYLREENKL